MGTSEWEAFVPRSHMLHLLTLGASCVCCFLSSRRPRSCSILVVPLFLIAPPFYTIGGAIFFAYLSITQSLPACLPLRMSLSSTRAGVLRFLGVPYGYWTACLPVPPCPHQSFPLLGLLPMMSSFQSFRSSSRPTGSHRQSPRFSTRRAGRGACSVLRCFSCPHTVV